MASPETACSGRFCSGLATRSWSAPAIVAFMLLIAGDVVGKAGGSALLWQVIRLLKILKE